MAGVHYDDPDAWRVHPPCDQWWRAATPLVRVESKAGVSRKLRKREGTNEFSTTIITRNVRACTRDGRLEIAGSANITIAAGKKAQRGARKWFEGEGMHKDYWFRMGNAQMSMPLTSSRIHKTFDSDSACVDVHHLQTAAHNAVFLFPGSKQLRKTTAHNRSN